ncbi:MAG: PHP domain-containing protein [Thermoanaerobaculia bacterium]
MKKEEISSILKEMANLLELSGENPFKVKAYYDASRIVLSIEDLEKKIKEGTLNKVKGIGQSLSDFIKRVYFEGTHPALEELRQKFSPEFLELLKIPGLGPKKLFVLQKELNITSIQDLKYAIYENRLLNISGFGEKTQEKLKENLKFYESVRGKVLLSEGIKIEEEVVSKFPQLHAAGQLRRRMPVIDCLEFVLKDFSLKRFQEELKNSEFFYENGDFFLKFKDLNIKIYEGYKNFYKVLFEVTGSKEHLEGLKKLGKIKEEINSEEEIYKSLNLDYIPPEMREGMGEIELARKHLISKIINFKDIRGTLHNHTIESDGSSRIEDYIRVAKEMGFEFVGIADHSRSAKYAGGLEGEELLKQREEIEKIGKENGFLIFSGVESDILVDGNLDYGEEILEKLDYVVGSIHSHFNLKKEQQTERILKAISNKNFKILGHPEGRILLGRKGYEIDMEEVLEKLSQEKKWVELNSNPLRLDLDWKWLPQAQKLNIPVSINPDAHYAADLKDVFYGVIMSRKGLLFKENCINAWEKERLKEEFKYYEKRRKNI